MAAHLAHATPESAIWSTPSSAHLSDRPGVRGASDFELRFRRQAAGSLLPVADRDKYGSIAIAETDAMDSVTDHARASGPPGDLPVGGGLSSHRAAISPWNGPADTRCRLAERRRP